MTRLAYFLSLLLPLAAAEDGWDETLARALSGKLRTIEEEAGKIAPQLDGLPVIPIADQGGTGGWAGVHSSARPWAMRSSVNGVRWDVGVLEKRGMAGGPEQVS